MRKSRWVASIVVVGVLAVSAFLAFPRGFAPSKRSEPAARPVGAQQAHSAATSEPAINRPGSEASSGATAAQWTAKFHASSDYRKFVADALPSATSGDGRAAWYIGQALTSCTLVVKDYRRTPNPEELIRRQLERSVNAPQWIRDLEVEKTNRCLGLAQSDPLEGLPHRDGGYPSAYWRNLALADKDPLAEAQAAADAIATISVTQGMSEEAKTVQVRVVDANIRALVQSGDPDALYYAGTLLSDPRYSSNSMNGIAVALAACDLGHDCSADNPENPFYNCKLSGECPSGADYAYFLQQSLGAGKYSQIYAHAQEIVQSVRSGEWDVVLKNLVVDKTP
jgi:hypothetical protein